MKVLVCGGRKFDDAMTLGSWLGGIHKKAGISLIIQGGAPGADHMAAKFGEWIGVPVQTFKADWALGKKAGPIRNERMLREGKPDLVVAFEGGAGTADMVSKATAAGVRVIKAYKVFNPEVLQ